MDGDRETLPPAAEMTVGRMRGRIFACFTAWGIDDEDRHDLATFVLQRRVTSYRDLSEDEWRTLYQVVSGTVAIREMRMQHGLVDAALRKVETWWDDDMVDPMFLRGVKEACAKLREFHTPAAD